MQEHLYASRTAHFSQYSKAECSVILYNTFTAATVTKYRRQQKPNNSMTSNHLLCWELWARERRPRPGETAGCGACSANVRCCCCLQPDTVSYTDILHGDTSDNQSFVWVLKGRTWTTARPEALLAVMAFGHQYLNLTSPLWLECCLFSAFFYSRLSWNNKVGVRKGLNRWSLSPN